jgi:tetratricopeptide (TPR) repeat protein
VLKENNFLWREVEEPNSIVLQKQLGEIDNALTQAIKPAERTDLVLQKAVLLGTLGRNNEARQCFLVVLEQGGDNPDVKLAAEFGIAALSDQEGNPTAALQRLTLVLHKFRDRLRLPDAQPLYWDIQQRRGIDLTIQESYQDAIPVLQECLQFPLKPQSKSILRFHLGLCYFNLTHFEKADIQFTQSLQDESPSEWEGQIHFFLGATLFKLGRARDAKKELALCEKMATSWCLPIERVYEALAGVCADLGEIEEAANYERLLRELSSGI